jgi:hypothetical protein
VRLNVFARTGAAQHGAAAARATACSIRRLVVLGIETWGFGRVAAVGPAAERQSVGRREWGRDGSGLPNRDAAPVASRQRSGALVPRCRREAHR